MKKIAHQRQADARSIISNPKPEHTASLRLLAWATLKAERGQTVCQRRLQAVIGQAIAPMLPAQPSLRAQLKGSTSASALLIGGT